MLLSLFDSHPQLSVYPPDSGFFYAYYPIYDTDEKTDEEKLQRIIEVFYRNFLLDLEVVSKKSAKNYPKEKLAHDFLEVMEGQECSPANLLMSAILAWEQNNPRGHREDLKGWIEKTTSTEIYATEVFRWFPNAKFIHLIRDPRDNFGSLKSGWESKYKSHNDSLERLLQSLLDRGGLGLRLAKVNQQKFGEDRYKVIRYEDLTTNPRPMMQELAEFCDVEFFDSLLQPTYYGFPWEGNNFDGLKFDKPSSANVGRWKERISTHEEMVIEFYLQREMLALGYQPEHPIEDCTQAVMNHYKWFNSAQLYSEKC